MERRVEGLGPVAFAHQRRLRFTVFTPKRRRRPAPWRVEPEVVAAESCHMDPVRTRHSLAIFPRNYKSKATETEPFFLLTSNPPTVADVGHEPIHWHSLTILLLIQDPKLQRRPDQKHRGVFFCGTRSRALWNILVSSASVTVPGQISHRGPAKYGHGHWTLGPISLFSQPASGTRSTRSVLNIERPDPARPTKYRCRCRCCTIDASRRYYQYQSLHRDRWQFPAT